MKKLPKKINTLGSFYIGKNNIMYVFASGRLARRFKLTGIVETRDYITFC